MSLQYDAFISYRHAPLDMEMAKKVHTGLETYHIPRSVQVKTGKKKMGRVFRDQEELPIGSDLDNNISSALAASGYLIVICSPQTPGSYWVCKEIETFIQMHGREHILAVLIEGEPDESFPKLLLTDDDGNPVEPLAADIRGATSKERNTKFRTEILRLAAPIIGCTYDDLKQRHRERMIKRTVTIVSVIAAIVATAGTAFGIYSSNVASRMKQLADEKSELANEKSALAEEKTRLADQILAEYKQKQENQSRFYAEEALSLLDAGNREDAVLVARSGLPGDGNDRPYVAEAEYALGKTLYAYDSGTTLKYDRILQHDMTVNRIIRSADKEKLISIDSGNKVYVYNASDWSRILTVDPALKEMNYTTKTVAADADSTGVYICTEKGLSKYDLSGELIYDNNEMEHVNGFCFDIDRRIAILASTDTLLIADADTGKTLNLFTNEEEYSFQGNRICEEHTSGIIAAPHYDHNAARTYVSLYDPKGGHITKTDVSDGYVMDICATLGGNIAVLSCNSDFASGAGVTSVHLDLLSPEGNILWSVPVDADIRNWATFDTMMKAHSYKTDAGEMSEIVIAMEYDVFGFDESTGRMNCHISARGNCSDLLVSQDSEFAYVSYLDGDVDVIDLKNGEIFTDPLIDTDMGITNALFVLGQAVLRPYMSSDLYVLSYHEAPDLIDLETLDSLMVFSAVSDDSSCYVLTPLGELSTFCFYDASGKQIHKYVGDMSFTVFAGFNDGNFLIAGKDEIIRIDPFSGEEKVTSRSGLPGDVGGTYGALSRNGKYAVFWDSRELCVLDTDEMKIMGSHETEDIISKAMVSEDGTAVYVFSGTEPVYRIDTGTWEVTGTGPEELIPHMESTLHEFMCLSHDGSSLAMFCMDGYVRIVDTGSMSISEEIPLSAKSRMFIGFTDDDRFLVIQGDDGRLRIWDISDRRYKSLTDTGTTMGRMICDTEDGLMAVMGNDELYLFETEGYGCKAFVQDGIAFLKKDNTFVLNPDNRHMFMTKYKDYTSLIKEADRQFKDSALDEIRKVKYNVE